MKKRIRKIATTPLFIVTAAAFSYLVVFYLYSLKRLQMLWASYFDLGIMHQTVWNTYKAIQTFDFSKFLMLTDPHGSGEQIYRMAIHADYAMAAIAPLYFIYSGPETLLFVQTAVLASGAVAIYFVIKKVLLGKLTEKSLNVALVVLPILYLMNFAVQRTNYYEFHGVTLATAAILWMYAAYVYKKYFAAFLLGVFAMLTKEQVGFSMSVFLFVEFALETNLVYRIWKDRGVAFFVKDKSFFTKKAVTLLLLSVISFVYVLITVFYIMPYFRQGNDHFALSYFTKSDSKNILDIAGLYFGRLFSLEAMKYISTLLGAVFFVPVFSVYLLPAIPEVLMNLISESSNMRNFYYQYTALITPWIFVATIYSVGTIIKKIRINFYFLFIVLTISTLYLSYLESPLFYSKRGGKLLPLSQANEQMDIHMWQQILSDDRIAVSSTGQFSPYLSGRKYFYDFGENYVKADYVMIRKNEIYNYPEKKKLIPIYEDLLKDERFIKIYTRGDVEVYKKEMM